MSRILVVDDDTAICRSLELQLTSRDHEVRTCSAVARVAEQLNEWAPEVALIDLRLPDGDGLSVMRQVLSRAPDCAAAIITGAQDMQATIQAIREGALDYLRKPLDFDEVLLLIEKAAARGPKRDSAAAVVSVPDHQFPAREIVGRDRRIVEVIKQVGLLSQSKVTVLIQGETGTGKELVARAIHEAGSPGAPFVAINCSAVVPTLLESELFGHEKGAFTGADARKIGKLELAGEGTVFLDEIADLPNELQAKLLRVLEEREFRRVGGIDLVAFRARVLAATHHDLSRLIADGGFRDDLYYRLCVASVAVPSLRERRDDIPVLVEHLLAKANRDLHRSVRRIPERLMERFVSYDWPGNVRELENILIRGVALSQGDVLDAEVLHFPPDAVAEPAATQSTASPPEAGESVKTLRQVERDHITSVLALTDWNIARTSRLLDISRPTLRKKIADYGLERPARG